jgi:signal transduction histidine kinase
MAELIIPAATRELHRAGLARHVATGRSVVIGKRIEMTAMRKDGSEFPVELAITKVDIPGHPLFAGHIRDITDRKRAQMETERALQAEREASRRLRDLDDMKNTFLQAVSHDLRTPLSAIIGLAITLERPEMDLSPELRGELNSRLVTNARKLYRILSNLLDLDRLSRGEVEPEVEPTDLRALVRRIVDEADYMGNRRVEVDAEDVIAKVDPTGVERIVENLLVNAAKHTPEGTPVWVRVQRQGEDVLIVVEDGGAGIPEGMRTTVFEPFRQGLHDHPSPGAGVGLSLVARFAELHSGRAWVEERPGGGASFHVLLPTRSRAPDSQISLKGAHARSSTHAPTVGPSPEAGSRPG